MNRPYTEAGTGPLLLQRVLAAFEAVTGGAVTTATEVEAKPYPFAHVRPDAIVRLTKGDDEWHFAAVIKATATPGAMGFLVAQVQRHAQAGLIVTRYVNPQMADRLKDKNIQFMDATGNAFINQPGLFIYVQGNKALEPQTVTRAFKPTGLRVVFALLCVPDLIHAPYRDIAKAAAVALGTVAWVIYDLKGTGFLIEMGKKRRRLADKARLLERWVTAFPEQLRPKLLLGQYRPHQLDWWKNANLTPFDAYWGGEVAAAKLTGYLTPERVILYTEKDPTNILLKYRMRKDRAGPVAILKKFWGFDYAQDHPDLVPPLLTYADLMATGDDRNIETAKIVYENELLGLIGET